MFGRVIRGYEDIIPKIVDIPTDEKDRPKVPIVISNCGELELRKKPVDLKSQQRKDISSSVPPSASAWLCGLCFSLTRNGSTRTILVAEVDNHLFSIFTPLFYLFLIFCTAEESTVSREVIGKEDDLPKRSRSRHKHKKRRMHRLGDDSDEDSRSRSLSPSRSRSPSRARSGSPDHRDGPALDSDNDRHHRGGSSRKRHRADIKSSSRKIKHRSANRSRSRSRSPMDVENSGSLNPNLEERKETEEEYDARLEREENERIAAEKQKRLEALKARHDRDLEKPPQNGVRFKGA